MIEVKKTGTQNLLNNPFVMFLYSILVMLVLLYFYLVLSSYRDLFSLAIQIFGAFIATYTGVYLSLTLTKKEDFARDQRLEEKKLIYSLKLLHNELSLNLATLKALRDGLSTMPKRIDQMYNGYEFLLLHTRSIKTKVFYGLVNSGDLAEVSLKDNLFNSLEWAYYNTEIIVGFHNLQTSIFKDFQDNAGTFSQDEINHALEIPAKEIEKLDRVIGYIEGSIKEISDFLLTKNVTFTNLAL